MGVMFYALDLRPSAVRALSACSHRAHPGSVCGVLFKIIRKYGIDVSTEMVVGAEGDTLESIRETAKFIEDNKITVPRFYILTLGIPGTQC